MGMYHLITCRWAAFGIGDSMIGSDIYIFWKNSTGGCVVSRRKTNSYSMPLLSEHQNSSIINLTNATTPDKLTCAISRPYSDSPILTNTTGLIWAIGGGVSNVDAADSSFSRHYKRGGIDPMSISKRDGSDSKDVSTYETSNSWSYFQSTQISDHIYRVILMVMLAFLVA